VFSPDGLNVGFSNNPNSNEEQSSGVFSLSNLSAVTGGGYMYNLFVDSNCIFDEYDTNNIFNGYDTKSIVFSPDGWYFFIGGGNGESGKYGIFEYKY
jgi:hypothetical protein